MTDNQVEIKPNQKHGGYRRGAGRKARTFEQTQQYLMARGFRVNTPLQAKDVLSFVVDEKRTWARIFASTDDRVVLDALKFLVSMRDGRPAQQINVTSVGVSISSSDISSVRDIARDVLRLSVSNLGMGEGANDGVNTSPHDTSPVIDQVVTKS